MLGLKHHGLVPRPLLRSTVEKCSVFPGVDTCVALGGTALAGCLFVPALQSGPFFNAISISAEVVIILGVRLFRPHAPCPGTSSPSARSCGRFCAASDRLAGKQRPDQVVPTQRDVRSDRSPRLAQTVTVSRPPAARGAEESSSRAHSISLASTSRMLVSCARSTVVASRPRLPVLLAWVVRNHPR